MTRMSRKTQDQVLEYAYPLGWKWAEASGPLEVTRYYEEVAPEEVGFPAGNGPLKRVTAIRWRSLDFLVLGFGGEKPSRVYLRLDCGSRPITDYMVSHMTRALRRWLPKDFDQHSFSRDFHPIINKEKGEWGEFRLRAGGHEYLFRRVLVLRRNGNGTWSLVSTDAGTPADERLSYYQRNAEQQRAYQRAYRQRNAERTKEYQREYYRKNAERMKEYQRGYYYRSRQTDASREASVKQQKED